MTNRPTLPESAFSREFWLGPCADFFSTLLGEPYLENHPDSVIAEVRRLEPVLVGQDPTQIERRWQAMYEAGLGYKRSEPSRRAL